ncbi:uncharacterized protein [Acropora muricata]|uniref:uncharacterized protein n=1 Tax=Acropora muricata TaxID=159855 RepID=UPI0034E5C533
MEEPKTVHEALNGEQSSRWREAMESEYSSLFKNDTLDLVPPPGGKNIVGSRWVLKVKHDENGSVNRFKARLVAQGYSQVKGVDYDEVFSPVARNTSVRSLLALASTQMAAWLAALCRLLTTLLVVSLFFNYMFQDSLKLESDRLGVGFSEFMVVSMTPSTPFDKQVLRRSGKTDAIGIPLSRKLALGVRLVNMALITNLFLLANDVAINPGPTQTFAHFSSYDSSFSSCFSNESFVSDSSAASDNEDSVLSTYYDLGLGDRGLRLGHWNVNYLTMAKFEEIKLCLLNADGKAQLDILFLSETFLKASDPDTLYSVTGFNTLRRDRMTNGGGILAIVNSELKLVILGTSLNALANVDCVSLSGLNIDSALSFNAHADKVCKKLASRIAVLRKIRAYLPLPKRIQYYNSIISPVMSYVSAIWSNCDKELFFRVFKLQKRAARVILYAERMAPSVELFNRLKWIPFYEKCKIDKASIMFKRIHGVLPSYLNEHISINNSRHSRTTRY